jgi:GMP synthase-like glutamine amidotransferase
MRVHYIQHCGSEDLANILPWLKKRGHTVKRTLIYKGEKLPSLDSFDWLIIMGGPMNVDEHKKYPWLIKEKEMIKRSIKAGKIVLGVCLGAQLISRVLGAKVKKNRYVEKGWHKVWLTPAGKKSVMFRVYPAEFTPIHWHGDTFGIPKGVKLLASSRACRNQAYQYGGKTFAVQFHIEYSPKHMLEYYKAEKDPDNPGKYEQVEKQIMGNLGRFNRLRELTNILLKNIENTSRYP